MFRYAYCHANAHAVGYTITFGFAHRHAFAQAFGNPERHPVADQAPQAAAAPPEAHPG